MVNFIVSLFSAKLKFFTGSNAIFIFMNICLLTKKEGFTLKSLIFAD